MKPNRILDFEAEYIKVKKNNKSLAKALAEAQQLNKKYMDENCVLQKKLYNSVSLNMHYERTLNELSMSLKTSIKSCIDVSNNLSNSIIICKEGTNISKALLESFPEDSERNAINKVTLRSVSPGNPHKTHAVKPMVSGHVINNISIKIPRLLDSRFAGLQSADSPVQNHNSDTYNTENNLEPLNNNTELRSISNHLPIRGFVPENIEPETDDSLEEDSLVLDHENNETSYDVSNNRLVVSLSPLTEVSEEEIVTPNSSSTLKEVRILIEPLHLANTYFYTDDKPPTLKPEKSRSKRTQDDPLEGTSSMLDESGNIMEYNNHNSKPRHSTKRMSEQNDSDSDESVIASERKNKRWITKRKVSGDKKDITGQKYKIKRNRTSDNESLDNSNEENTGNNIEERDGTERRSRRRTVKSLVEPSLKSKMRR